jgi:hypothetical protein
MNMNEMLPYKIPRPGRGGLDRSLENADDTPESHPLQGIIENTVQEFLDGTLDKDGALKRLAGALALYQHEASDAAAETESSRNAWTGRTPRPPVDAKAHRAELLGCELTLTAAGERVLESGRGRATKYSPQRAASEWHGRGGR